MSNGKLDQESEFSVGSEEEISIDANASQTGSDEGGDSISIQHSPIPAVITDVDNEYMRKRAERIARNNWRLAALGFLNTGPVGLLTSNTHKRDSSDDGLSTISPNLPKQHVHELRIHC